MFHEGRYIRRGQARAQASGAVFFVTCRLADSISPLVVQQLCAARRRWLRRFALRGANPSHHLADAHKLLFGQFDDLLDRAIDGTGLARPEAASAVRHGLRRLDGTSSRLLAYCVMPSHVHALIRLPALPEAEGPAALGEQADAAGPLARMLPAWKRATAKLTGLAWHTESFLQRVHDGEELHRLVDYIAYNPVKAGLARQVHEWPWCSAHDRFRLDGVETAWLIDP